MDCRAGPFLSFQLTLGSCQCRLLLVLVFWATATDQGLLHQLTPFTLLKKIIIHVVYCWLFSFTVIICFEGRRVIWARRAFSQSMS